METSPGFARYLAAVELHNQGRYAEALRAFDKAVALDPGMYRFHANRARCLSALERHDAAIAAARRAIELAPAEWFAHHAHISVLDAADREREVVAAIGALETIEIPAITHAEVLATAAHAQIRLGQDTQAIALARRAVELAPESAAAHGALATALGMQHRMGAALVEIDRAIELAPDDEFFRDRRATLAEGAAVLEGALVATRSEPPCVENWGSIGALLDLLGRYDEAVAAFDRAIELDPDDPASWDGRGWALHRAGDRFPEDVVAFRKAGALRAAAARRERRKSKPKSKSKSKPKPKPKPRSGRPSRSKRYAR